MHSTRSFALLACLAACGTQASAGGDAEMRALGIANTFTPPIEGVYCSGQSTPEQFEKLPSAGVHRVISLRVESEQNTGWEEQKAKDLGIEFVRLPIQGAGDINVDSAKKLAKLIEDGDKPVLVCCGSSNRVGALFALKAHFLDGASEADALELGKQCGLTRLESVVQQQFAK